MTHPLRRLAASLTLACLATASLPAQDNTASPVPARSMLTQPPTGEVPPPHPQELTLPSTAPELTLQECITRALNKNFDLEIGRYAPQIAQDGIESAKAGFDPTLSLTSTRSFSQQPNSQSTLDGSPAPTSDSTNTRLAVNQKIATGATVGLSTRLSRSSTNSSFNTLNPAYNADATVSVSQPLLRGFGSSVTQAGIHRAEIGLQRANLDFKTQALVVIQNTENAYYNLAFAREQLDVRKFSLALANRLFDEAKTRRDTGVATDLDVLQAEVGVANARRGTILAEQAVKDRQDSLLALIGQFALDETLGTVRFSEVTDSLPVFGSSYAMAKQNQPDFLSSQAAIEQLRLDLQIAKNAKLPSLSVGGALGYNARESSAGSAYSAIPDGDGYAWQVDLSLSVPLGFRGDKASYRQSLATFNREQVRLRLIEQNIEIQVRSAVRSVETNTESVKIATLASTLSQRQYELEKARFDAGLSTSRRVLEAQNDLETARSNELQAKVTLHTAIAALHRIEGSSLQRYAVQLP